MQVIITMVKKNNKLPINLLSLYRLGILINKYNILCILLVKCLNNGNYISILRCKCVILE